MRQLSSFGLSGLGTKFSKDIFNSEICYRYD